MRITKFLYLTSICLRQESLPVEGAGNLAWHEILTRNRHATLTSKGRRIVGTVVIHLGGDPKVSSYIYMPAVDGRLYIMRFYQTHQELLDGSWGFPEAKPVRNSIVVLG